MPKKEKRKNRKFSSFLYKKEPILVRYSLVEKKSKKQIIETSEYTVDQTVECGARSLQASPPLSYLTYFCGDRFPEYFFDKRRPLIRTRVFHVQIPQLRDQLACALSGAGLSVVDLLEIVDYRGIVAISAAAQDGSLIWSTRTNSSLFCKRAKQKKRKSMRRGKKNRVR